MNRTILIGRLTRDPEIRYTQGANPVAVASFTIACDRGKNKDGSKVTDFVPCKAWGKVAELLSKYVHKGQRIGAEGHIETGSFTKRDGSKGFSVEVNVEKIEFLEKLGDPVEPVPVEPLPEPVPEPTQEAFVPMDYETDEGMPF